MKNKSIIFTLCIWALGSVAFGQNPVIRDQFTADPTARMFEGKVYLYPSHDIPAPEEYPRKDWFCMADYHVFSSSDLTHWTDHGIILEQNSIDWVEPNSFSMWAPDCVFKNGKYYYYFPSVPKGVEKKGFGVGVAVSDKPYGPFVAEKRPIEGIRGIDPSVLVDKDGQSYIYWAGGNLYMAKLKDNMMELASEPQVIEEGLPKGFKEGPFVFERKGIYYLTYPWVQDKTETLAYSYSHSPMGPFKFGGIIMEQSPTECWTNHHSLVEYKGQWYLFYHHNDYSPKFDKNRSVRIDSLNFNLDGTIQKVIPTLRGVGINSATERIQLDRYSEMQGATIALLDTLDTFQGWSVCLDKPGSYVRYNRVNFEEHGLNSIKIRRRNKKPCLLEIRLDGLHGTLVTSAQIPASSEWDICTVPLKTSPEGLHDLYVICKEGDACEVDWMKFDNGRTAGNYRNLLREAGYSQKDIDSKLKAAFDAVFTGPRKVYQEVGDSMGYISDVKNHDVRTEGMSYGMMIAVQMDKQDLFNRLWRWAKKYMQHQDGPREGYFGWSCKVDGTQNAAGTASDGELYFVTSLLFASNRWGDNGAVNYHAEAKRILDCMFAKTGKDGINNIINTQKKLITFVPERFGALFTDPSYHLPVFYEIWARYAKDGRSDFWYACAREAREYLHKACHPVTGLNPDYSRYDGQPMAMRGSDWGAKFRFDSWRVPMNIALDYTWSGADAFWQQDYARRIHRFFRSEGVSSFVDQYDLDGKRVTNIAEVGGYKVLRHSIGLVGTLAAASLMLPVEESKDFIAELWNARLEPYADGYYDGYYDGLLYLFSLMHLSGNYRIIEPGK